MSANTRSGAAAINSVFMPLGSAVIEVKPLGFTGIWPNHYLRKMLTLTDKNQSIFWFGLNIVQQKNSEPGPEERHKKEPAYFWERDRHVRLETDRLQELFDKIVLVDRNVQRYAELAASNGHYLNDDGTKPTDWVDQECYEEAERKKRKAEEAERMKKEGTKQDGVEGAPPSSPDDLNRGFRGKL